MTGVVPTNVITRVLPKGCTSALQIVRNPNYTGNFAETSLNDVPFDPPEMAWRQVFGPGSNLGFPRQGGKRSRPNREYQPSAAVAAAIAAALGTYPPAVP